MDGRAPVMTVRIAKTSAKSGAIVTVSVEALVVIPMPVPIFVHMCMVAVGTAHVRGRVVYWVLVVPVRHDHYRHGNTH